jgi:hypothetical protein
MDLVAEYPMVGTELAETEAGSSSGYQGLIRQLDERVRVLERDRLHETGNYGARLSMAGVIAVGGSSESGESLQQLEAGTHDPKKNGVTVQAFSLAVHAELDRNIEVTGSIVSHIEPDGESIVELEQAFIEVGYKQNNITLLAGQHFLEFGEENIRHPDDWDFVDIPVIMARIFGSDKLRSQGIRVKWSPSWDSQSSYYWGAYNPHGESVKSYFYVPGETVAGHPILSRGVNDPSDLVYFIKWARLNFNGSKNPVNIGLSFLLGPNATGNDTRTGIAGLNLGWRHYAVVGATHPVFDWTTEVMYRRYEAGDPGSPGAEILRDYGMFSQIVWQYQDQWTAALRGEIANANNNDSQDPERNKRKRLALSITHSLNKRASLRIQYNKDQAANLTGGSADSIWMQFIFHLGDDEHG